MKKLLLAGVALGALTSGAWAVAAITTTLSNANYQVSNTDCKMITGSTLTAARTLSLPYAGGTMIGQGFPASGPGPCQGLDIWDIASGISSLFTLTIVPQPGDTINGVSSPYVLSQPGMHVTLVPFSGGGWWLGNSDAMIYTTFITSAANLGGTALTSGAATNILSLPNLGMGLWDCSAALALDPQATTPVSSFTVWLTTASASLPGTGNIDFQGLSKWWAPTAGVTAPSGLELPVGPMRFAITTPTTVYAEALANFNTAQLSAYGMLTCRNVN